MFLDASALVAILSDEPEADHLIEKMEANSGPYYYSSLVVFETVIALARKKKAALLGPDAVTPPLLLKDMQAVVEGFLSGVGALQVPVEAGAYQLALEAAQRFGRATGHPARLNFGDCFAYASARALDAPLLFVGNDFTLTDIKPA